MYKQHIIRTLIFGAIGLAIALIAGFLSPKIYEGRVEMLIGDAGRMGGASVLTEDVSSIVDRGRSRNAATERQILSSQGVFFRAVAAVAEQNGDNNLVANWDQLYRMYDVETARTNTQTDDAGVAIIKVRAYGPEVAAEIANQIGFVFNDVRQQEARAALEDGIRALEGRVQSAQQELLAAENRLQQYKTEVGVADVGVDIQGLANMRNGLASSLDAARAELASATAATATYRRQLSELPTRVLDSEQEGANPVLAALENQLNLQLSQRAELLGTYLEDSPQVKRVDNSIQRTRELLAEARKTPMTSFQSMTRLDTIRQQVQGNLKQSEASVASLSARVASLERELAAKDAAIAEQPAREREIVRLSRDVAIQDENYRRDKQQLEILRSRSATGVRSAATILNTARADEDPVAPELTKFAFIGLFAGLSLGLLVSFLIDSLRSNVRSATQLSYLTGLPVVASVPALRAAAPRALRALARRTLEPAEGYRYMAFALGSSASTGSVAYGFTSARGTAGSAVGALQFAIAAARTGQRVLLIDADLGRAALSRSFDAESAPGLRNALGGDAAQLDSLAQSTPHENLRLLPAGQGASTTLADFAIGDVANLVELAKGLADVVVLALPPCDAQVDAVAVSRHIDHTVLTVSGQRSTANQIADTVEMLKNAGVPNLRLILADAVSGSSAAIAESTDLAKVE